MDPSDHRIIREFDCTSEELLGEYLHRIVLFEV